MSNSSPSHEVEGKVVLVTGAASGIGRATAELLHARGARVIAEDINPDVKQLARTGLVPLVEDIGRDGAAEAAVSLARDTFGTLDVLVNNAGTIFFKPIVDTSRSEWDALMATNLTGAFLHAREAMKVMIPNKRGSIINIASYASQFAFPGIGAYAASKGGMAQLTRVLAMEAIEDGIRVNAIGVGDVVTNIASKEMEDGPAFLAKHGESAPIKRAAEPQEIAEIVAFLASERASFMVGAMVMADGGMTVKAG